MPGLRFIISFRTAPGRNKADITKRFTTEAIETNRRFKFAKRGQILRMWKMVAKEYREDDALRARPVGRGIVCERSGRSGPAKAANRHGSCPRRAASVRSTSSSLDALGAFNAI